MARLASELFPTLTLIPIPIRMGRWKKTNPLGLAKTSVWNILKKMEGTSELTNTKRPRRQREGTGGWPKNSFPGKKKPLHSSWPGQKHSPGSSRTNWEAFRATLSASELLEQKATREFPEGKKRTEQDPPGFSLHLTCWRPQMEATCPENQQEVKTAAAEGWQSIPRDETQRLVTSARSRRQAGLDRKGVI